ncbi:hypothetical protein IWQ60_012355 [Tieghemiomyces parasiticus]|uniref:Uncharacterized protein n=1 Tax=Tieghemiomyces parasiticus TaxID=78921 RepID=A0A9W7ZI33_9FUNG|nr:hypothetical protein IWQ60_012355 [Tieghemiomyces parasiticus]
MALKVLRKVPAQSKKAIRTMYRMLAHMSTSSAAVPAFAAPSKPSRSPVFAAVPVARSAPQLPPLVFCDFTVFEPAGQFPSVDFTPTTAGALPTQFDPVSPAAAGFFTPEGLSPLPTPQPSSCSTSEPALPQPTARSSNVLSSTSCLYPTHFPAKVDTAVVSALGPRPCSAREPAAPPMSHGSPAPSLPTPSPSSVARCMPAGSSTVSPSPAATTDLDDEELEFLAEYSPEEAAFVLADVEPDWVKLATVDVPITASLFDDEWLIDFIDEGAYFVLADVEPDWAKLAAVDVPLGLV